MTNLIPTIPTDLVDQINYSESSIVSKILLNSEKLQITLFAVDKDQSFSEHTTTKEAIVHVIEGEGEFYIKDKWYSFKENDYFYMPPNCIHSIKAKSKFKFLLYQF